MVDGRISQRAAGSDFHDLHVVGNAPCRRVEIQAFLLAAWDTVTPPVGYVLKSPPYRMDAQAMTDTVNKPARSIFRMGFLRVLAGIYSKVYSLLVINRYKRV